MLILAPWLAVACCLSPLDNRDYGRSLLLCGDLDGDGYREVVIGSPLGGEHGEGVVFIYSGKTYVQLFALIGDASGSLFGTDFVDVGDQDGDGVPDLAISAPDALASIGHGEVQIRSGKTGKCIRKISAAPDEACFGMHLAAIGDVNGDKASDLVIHLLRNKGQLPVEEFAVVSGRDGTRLGVVRGDPGLDCAYDGRPLACMGDIDLDGVSDYAIEVGRRIRVISGKTGQPILECGGIVAQPKNSTFGMALCCPGDLNNDSYPDIVVGDPESFSTSQEGMGVVYAYSGKDGSLLWSKKGDQKHEGLGFCLLPAGDVNKDGVSDIYCGWHSAFGGGVLTLSGRDGTPASRNETRSDDMPQMGRRLAGERDATVILTSRYSPNAAGVANQSMLLLSKEDFRCVHTFSPPLTQAPKK